ncbi:unnamed protein product [Pseudo-nitzschia multistriata]|uniref:Uncharacterized protein n=1 Tax=Pseudo-nitzschia multistriata TaxID=183589 RepID=A0A448Z075_9STRA|nr:unnamed protein product [Pseudo-nitzschia multistriata]
MPTRIRFRNVLVGIIVILGLPSGPEAFNTISSHVVLSRIRVTPATTTTSKTKGKISHAKIITAAFADKNNNWEMNRRSDDYNVIEKIALRPTRLSLLAITFLLAFRKFLTVSGFHARLGQSLVTLKKVWTPGIAVTLFRLVKQYSSSLSARYMDLLACSPLWTKTVTTSVLAVAGDSIAQYIETHKFSPSVVEGDEGFGKTKDVAVSAFSVGSPFSWLKDYDRRRGISILGENMLISGPLLHFSYNFMEQLIPTNGGGKSAFLAALSHSLIDNFILDTIFLAIMFVTTGIAEGYVQEIIPQFKKDFFPTLRTGWIAGICLLPVQFLIFRFLPLSLRVLGVNIIDMFWGAYVSYMVHRRRQKPQQ